MSDSTPSLSSPPSRGASGDVLRVIVARSAGTCFGVRAAISLAQREQKPILGPLVHNPRVVSDLAGMGIPIYERFADLDSLPPEVTEVIITAHGYPRHLKESLQDRGIRYLDATCPVLLRWVYEKIRRFTEEGLQILLIGNPRHAEVIASKSYGPDIWVAYTEAEIDALPACPGPMVAICQTTITREEFVHLVRYARETRFPHLRAVDTRCKPVRQQQEGVGNLASWVDAMLIIGGHDSSNTNKLVKIAQRYLPDSTYHVDDPARIEAAWLQGVAVLGVGAGTSTPSDQITAAMERIAALHPGPVIFEQEEKAERHEDPEAQEEEV